MANISGELFPNLGIFILNTYPNACMDTYSFISDFPLLSSKESYHLPQLIRIYNSFFIQMETFNK